MQIKHLPSAFYRAARYLSPGTPVPAIAELRADALRRWRQGRRTSSASAAAEVVGVSRTTLYRWAHRYANGGPKALIPQTRRPHTVRQPAWSAALQKEVQEVRLAYPAWGAAKLTVLLRRAGHTVSERTVGRILHHLVARAQVQPVARTRSPRARRRRRPHATRLPRGLRPTTPGQQVQVDTLTVTVPGTPTVHQFTAYDPVSKWTCAAVYRRATAAYGVRFLDHLEHALPFSVHSLQVDGGSEFHAAFERSCADRGRPLYVLPPRTPQLNGHVERNNGAWRSEFYRCWDVDGHDLAELNRRVQAFAEEYNTFRPHHSLGGLTPAEYLASHHGPRPP